MNRITGDTNSATHGLETDPRDGGCPRCGRPCSVVDLSDFGLAAGQHCPVHGVVHATDLPAVTDGGMDDCEYDGLDDLECWYCYRRTGR